MAKKSKPVDRGEVQEIDDIFCPMCPGMMEEHASESALNHKKECHLCGYTVSKPKGMKGGMNINQAPNKFRDTDKAKR